VHLSEPSVSNKSVSDKCAKQENTSIVLSLLAFNYNKISDPYSRLTVHGCRSITHTQKTPKTHVTLKFNRVLEVVEIHVHAKFHQAECSGSWVIITQASCCILQQWKIR